MARTAVRIAAMVPVALVTFGAYRVINWSFVNL